MITCPKALSLSLAPFSPSYDQGRNDAANDAVSGHSFSLKEGLDVAFHSLFVEMSTHFLSILLRGPLNLLLEFEKFVVPFRRYGQMVHDGRHPNHNGADDETPPNQV
jgi:hypothetical protein